MITEMADDLLSVLTRFHREIVLPDIEEVVAKQISPLRDEMLSGFDAVFKRLDPLDSEFQSLSAATRRLEGQMASVEQKIDKMAVRSELVDLKQRIHALENRVAELESQL